MARTVCLGIDRSRAGGDGEGCCKIGGRGMTSPGWVGGRGSWKEEKLSRKVTNLIKVMPSEEKLIYTA